MNSIYRICIFLILLCSLVATLLSCTKEIGESALPQSKRLYISAVSANFRQSGEIDTKTQTYGFFTTFESGDKIGVTGIDKDGNILDVCNNILFTYHNDTLINGIQYSQFINQRGYSFVERVDGAKYFAYYPYNADYNGKSLEEICENFAPLEDQHTKESFDKSDLMAPEAPILPAGDKLLFEMKHKMATISIFYNNEWKPNGDPLYDILLYSQTSPASLRLENTYRAPTGENTLELRHRYLVNPKSTPTVKLVGSLLEKSVRYFSSTLNVEPGVLYSISFEGAPLVQYSDGVDLALDNVEFVDKDGNTVTLGHTVMWSKYNLGESKGESYPFSPHSGDRGTQNGSRDSLARGDYYAWGATFTQYDNGLTGYTGYGYNNYFDNNYKIAPLGGTIKETEYDVAHAKWWRGKWRLPTENEFRALYAGCTFKVETTYQESQNRYIDTPGTTRTFKVIKVTSKVNGKSIYFSTGGYLDGTVEPKKDAQGNFTPSGDGKTNQGIVDATTAYYMTSTASPSILKCVSYAYFNAEQQKQLININGSRYTGMLVRPVYSPNEY